MYVKVMAAVIACILMSGETHSTSATIPATENQSWFKKRKKKPEQEEKTKSDYEKLVEQNYQRNVCCSSKKERLLF